MKPNGFANVYLFGPLPVGAVHGIRQVKEVVRFIVWNESLLHAEDEESSGLPSGGSSELICFSRDAPRTCTYPGHEGSSSFACILIFHTAHIKLKGTFYVDAATR